MTEDQKYSDFMYELMTTNEESNDKLETTFIENQCSFLVDQDVLQSFHILR